ncbi:MAG TPA: DnaA/Hda family protein [Longimicrobiaceae bacterium]|jgi:hypothetical protein|nr:DnaA/Hda family protein [Longimicrobiaceae bacterium]
MTFEQDPRFTFDTFVAGPGSRMAAAAARRAAESPGTSYNPLFLYGGRGVGKTHLLHAVGGLARTVRPDLRVVYQTAEQLVDGLTAAVASGTVEAWRDAYVDAELLLLDDVQMLAGMTRTQDELLRLWDAIDRTRVQFVLAGDRPPPEIDGLSDALRARLSGGLTVDIAPAEVETRLAIVEQAARDGGVELSGGAAEAIAGLPLDGGHDLQRGVGRLGEVQRAEGRPLPADEVASLLAPAEAAAPVDEFSAFLSDIAFTVEQLVEAAPWRKTLAEAILRWEGEGIRCRRLEEALETDSAPDVESLISGFSADVDRLRAAAAELEKIEGRASSSPLLKDPDRAAEAEALVEAARAEASRRAADPAGKPAEPGPRVDRWFFNAEKVAWSWVALDDRIIEEVG